MAKYEREYARIDVRLQARVRPLDEKEAEALKTELARAASVWAPMDEASLREMMNGTSPEEAILARGLLDLSDQFVRLKATIERQPQNTVQVEVIQISGGGGRFTCPAPIGEDELLEIRYTGDEIPPVKALIRVVHVHEDSLGFKYEKIHPRDKDRLIRLVYRLQRLALREAQL